MSCTKTGAISGLPWAPLSVPDEDYSRHVFCTLILISMFLLLNKL